MYRNAFNVMVLNYSRYKMWLQLAVCSEGEKIIPLTKYQCWIDFDSVGVSTFENTLLVNIRIKKLLFKYIHL